LKIVFLISLLLKTAMLVSITLPANQ